MEASLKKEGRSIAFDYHLSVPDLVPSSAGDGQDLERLRSRAAALETELADRLRDLARVDAALSAFKIRYRQDVGLLHEELDDLERAIDEIERGEIARQIESGAREARSSSNRPRPQAAPRLTTDAVRKLFRDVAKAIHPDLAGDDHARDRRHALMIEANRAYALGDEQRLRSILDAWARSPDAVLGTGHEAERERLVRRVAQIDEQLEACAAELAEIKATPLWQLKAMVDEAAGRGRDLVADMVRRLRRDILAARNRLEAIQPRA